jgi:DNA-directed RNA polymerase subunit RPC12/RpoP
VMYGTLVRNRWGINAGDVVCPRCHKNLPKMRQPRSLRQEMWGGATCSNCGAEVDKWGRELHGGEGDPEPKAPQSSPRSEQTGKPMETTFLDRLKPRSPVSWVILAVLIALNVWYDYHHPLGIMFDVVLAVGLLIWYLSKSKPV